MLNCLLLMLILAVLTQVNAQERSKFKDCRKLVVYDSDRRRFDTRSFALDVDDDGKLDTITSRTYRLKVNRSKSSKIRSSVRENYWIAFDLKTSKGRNLKSFFRYNYGTNEAVYWVYAFVPCRLNRNGRTHLLFYSGDDTSQESVILVNAGNTFKVFSRKVEELSDL